MKTRSLFVVMALALVVGAPIGGAAHYIDVIPTAPYSSVTMMQAASFDPSKSALEKLVEDVPPDRIRARLLGGEALVIDGELAPDPIS